MDEGLTRALGRAFVSDADWVKLKKRLEAVTTQLDQYGVDWKSALKPALFSSGRSLKLQYAGVEIRASDHGPLSWFSAEFKPPCNSKTIDIIKASNSHNVFCFEEAVVVGLETLVKVLDERAEDAAKRLASSDYTDDVTGRPTDATGDPGTDGVTGPTGDPGTDGVTGPTMMTDTELKYHQEILAPPQLTIHPHP